MNKIIREVNESKLELKQLVKNSEDSNGFDFKEMINKSKELDELIISYYFSMVNLK